MLMLRYHVNNKEDDKKSSSSTTSLKGVQISSIREWATTRARRTAGNGQCQRSYTFWIGFVWMRRQFSHWQLERTQPRWIPSTLVANWLILWFNRGSSIVRGMGCRDPFWRRSSCTLVIQKELQTPHVLQDSRSTRRNVYVVIAATKRPRARKRKTTFRRSSLSVRSVEPLLVWII